MWVGRGRGRGRVIQADSPPSSEPDAGLYLMTLKSCPKPKLRVREPHRCSCFLYAFKENRSSSLVFLSSNSILKSFHLLLLFFIVAIYSLTKVSQRPVCSRTRFHQFSILFQNRYLKYFFPLGEHICLTSHLSSFSEWWLMLRYSTLELYSSKNVWK